MFWNKEQPINDMVIEILRYGRNNLLSTNDGIQSGALRNYLRDEKRLNMNIQGNLDLLQHVLNNSFHRNNPVNGRYTIKLDAYFALLEHEELQEARASSKQANCWAIIALLVSIISLVASIFVTLDSTKKQIESPTTIDQNQFNTIVNSIPKGSVTIVNKLSEVLNHSSRF